MAYVPKHVTQADGSDCQWTNCWAATGAWLIDGGTRGRKKPTPMQFRKAARAMKGCRTGGYGDLILGLAAFGVKARLLSDVPIKEARKRLRNASSRKLYAMASDWSRWPDVDKCRGDYDGYHMAGLAPGRKTDKKGRAETRTNDPLCSRLRFVRTLGVLRAGEEYNREHYGKKGTVDLLVITVPRRP
jgi:hypothetical protein